MALSEEISQLLDRFGTTAVERAMRNLGATRTVNGRKVRRVASGRLKNDLTYRIKSRYNKPTVIFTTKSEATGRYADVIEYGRTPGRTQPPVEPIIQWMKIKGIRLRNSRGEFVKGSEADIRRAAFNIARSIGKRGIKGIRYFNEAVNDTLEEFNEEFIAAMNKEIEIRLQLNKR